VQRDFRGSVVSPLARISFLCGLVVACQQFAVASEKPQSKILCRDQITPAHRQLLLSELGAITGLTLKCDPDADLTATSSVGHVGSPTARDLISKALTGRNVIIIEDASERQDVVFSRVVPARWKHHVSAMPPAFVVLIDFADFNQLVGDAEALEAFNIGWAFLHELDHVVNDSSDSAGLNETGECEAHINAMRRECGLPSRAEYFFTFFPAAEQSEFRTRFVRIAFDKTDAKTNKLHRYWVTWDAVIVGGLQVATAR
jgi:hypothetical protein